VLEFFGPCKRKDPVSAPTFRPVGCEVSGVANSLVSEPDSCLYISDEGGIRGKGHSDTLHQFGIRA
jgi:hypothetical protein